MPQTVQQFSRLSSRIQHNILSRNPSIFPSVCTQVRYATHGSAGRANGPKNGPGKRLGAKKTGDEYVIPGNIIFRQRGALWHPGDNVGMGRDHTIFALESGYVKYYRNPALHPKRRYIGVVFDKNQTLPAPRDAARRRKLNMQAVPRVDLNMDALPSELQESNKSVTRAIDPTISERENKRRQARGMVPLEELRMQPDYSFRETNWQIGRAAERAGVTVAPYKPNDRFAAWRKRTVRRKIAIEKRSLTRKKPSARKAKRN